MIYKRLQVIKEWINTSVLSLRIKFPQYTKNQEQAFQIGSVGRGAVSVIFSLLTGCTKSIFLACKWILPFLLLLGNPYFRSPLIGLPMDES